MIPAKKDITVRFGDIHEIFFRVRKKVWDGTAWVLQGYQDLTGWTVLCQIRDTEDSDPPIATYSVTLGDQSDVTNGRGAVYLKLTSAQTGAIERTKATGVYDIQLTNASGDSETYAEGKVTFKKDVSRTS